jgi:hypothetical protein
MNCCLYFSHLFSDLGEVRRKTLVKHCEVRENHLNELYMLRNAFRRLRSCVHSYRNFVFHGNCHSEEHQQRCASGFSWCLSHWLCSGSGLCKLVLNVMNYVEWWIGRCFRYTSLDVPYDTCSCLSMFAFTHSSTECYRHHIVGKYLRSLILGNFQRKMKSIINNYYNRMICNRQVKLHIQRNIWVAPPLLCLIIDIMFRKIPFGSCWIVQYVGETVLINASYWFEHWYY